MYTGVIDEPSTGRTPQHQCLAWTDDGIHVEKAGENPVVGLDMTPEGTCPYDFRDPKLEKNGDHYRIVVAAKINNEGKVLSYSSADLKKWTYDGVYAEGFGEMSECPDCFEIDGRRVVISSIMACKDKDLVLPQPVVYMIQYLPSSSIAVPEKHPAVSYSRSGAIATGSCSQSIKFSEVQCPQCIGPQTVS